MSSFLATGIAKWTGRYSRVVGDESVFHLKTIDGDWWPTVTWRKDDTKCICTAVDVPGVRELANAVAHGKQSLGCSGGGTFQINEFGQVLVPSSEGTGERVMVGEWRGKLEFNDPETGRQFSLDQDHGLSCGDLWRLPYLGMKYQLHKGSRLYFYRYTEDGGESEFPDVQDEDLIKKVRAIRRTGAVRLVVNLHGLVLVRRPVGGSWTPEEEWEAVYVGRINPRKWFSKES